VLPPDGGSSKSIAKSIRKASEGDSRAQPSPARTSTVWRTFSARTGEDCRRRPLARIAATKGAAEPSRIGTSGPSISIRALVTPVPASAAIRCSTVETVTPSSLASRVQSCAGTTLCHSADTIAFRPTTSVRRNQIPCSAAAGRSTTRAGAPPCRPVPEKAIADFRVVCMPWSVLSAPCGVPRGLFRRAAL
jgi:hypothetical protein